MGRNIVSKPVSLDYEGYEPSQVRTMVEKYACQIVKRIPADIAGVYLGYSKFIVQSFRDTKYIIQLIIFLADKKQKVIAVISFGIWVFH